MQAGCNFSDSSLAPATVHYTQLRLNNGEQQMMSYDNQQQVALSFLVLHGAAVKKVSLFQMCIILQEGMVVM